jgi:hypothetical protein
MGLYTYGEYTRTRETKNGSTVSIEVRTREERATLDYPGDYEEEWNEDTLTFNDRPISKDWVTAWEGCMELLSRDEQ